MLALNHVQVEAINGAIDRYNTLVFFVKHSLRAELDYGVIPGCGDKPILFKPGAEKISTLFGFHESIERLEAVKDWTGERSGDEPFFAFEYKTTIRDRAGIVIAECVGSCNSWETKYRYRKAERTCPHCGSASIIKGKQEYGGGWLCYKTKGGCGAKFPDGDLQIEGQEVGLVPNNSIFDQVNTIDKMAQKRSFVGAVILASNASNFFSVEHTELNTIDADWEPAEPIALAQEIQPVAGGGMDAIDQGEINRARIATIVELTGHTASQIKAISGVPSASELSPAQTTQLVHNLLIHWGSPRLSEPACQEILAQLLQEQPGITDSGLRDRFAVRVAEYPSEQPWRNPPSEKYAGFSID